MAQAVDDDNTPLVIKALRGLLTVVGIVVGVLAVPFTLCFYFLHAGLVPAGDAPGAEADREWNSSYLVFGFIKPFVLAAVTMGVTIGQVVVSCILLNVRFPCPLPG